jgi:Fe-S-cluster-containing dehydrogenase component
MQYAMLIDLTLCTGCNSCLVSCKQENRLVEGVSWIRMKLLEQKNYPRYEYFYPQSCRHCEDPDCARVCPAGAITCSDKGIVLHNESKCIGCRLCVQFCQCGGLTINSINGKPGKCRLCIDRIKEGKLPACVENCSTEARYFDSREELLKNAKERLEKLAEKGQKAIFTADSQQNETAVFYIIPEGASFKRKNY